MPEELTERVHRVENDFAEATSWSHLDRQDTDDYSGRGTEIERIVDQEGRTIEAVWNSTWTEIVPGIRTRREAGRRCVRISPQACPVRILFRSWIEYVSYSDPEYSSQSGSRYWVRYEAEDIKPFPSSSQLQPPDGSSIESDTGPRRNAVEPAMARTVTGTDTIQQRHLNSPLQEIQPLQRFWIKLKRLEQFSFGFTKHKRSPWMPACAGMTDQETSSSVIPAKAGIQFLVNAFAIRSSLGLHSRVRVLLYFARREVPSGTDR